MNLLAPAITQQGNIPWPSLTPKQKVALAPLADIWMKVPTEKQKAWIAVANKYASLTHAQQKRLQANMLDWAKLPPKERNFARIAFSKLQGLPENERAREWGRYMRLSSAERAELAKQAKQTTALIRPLLPPQGYPPYAIAKKMSLWLTKPVRIQPFTLLPR